jgi:hypothetical protein
MLSKITKLVPLLKPFAATKCADIDIVANRLKCRYPDTFLVRNEEAIAPISRFLMIFNRGPRRSLWRALEPCRMRSWCHNCDLIRWCLLRFATCSLVTNPHGIVADTGGVILDNRHT